FLAFAPAAPRPSRPRTGIAAKAISGLHARGAEAVSAEDGHSGPRIRLTSRNVENAGDSLPRLRRAPEVSAPPAHRSCIFGMGGGCLPPRVNSIQWASPR